MSIGTTCAAPSAQPPTSTARCRRGADTRGRMAGSDPDRVSSMKILTWNVNGRVGDAARRQIRAVLRRRPDVICLQEVTGKPAGRHPGSYPIWSEALLGRGYSVASTVDLVALPSPETSDDTASPRPEHSG